MNQDRQEKIIREYFRPQANPEMVEQVFDRFALQSRRVDSDWFTGVDSANNIPALYRLFMLERFTDRIYRIVERFNCRDFQEVTRFWFDETTQIWHGEFNDLHPDALNQPPDRMKFTVLTPLEPERIFGPSPVEKTSRIVRLLDAIDKLLKR